MGTSDGAVLGTIKIVDHGPNTARFNLVILGDGYRTSELGTYHSDASTFINTLKATAPFDTLWCAINVHRVDVTSTDSGADDPATCGDKTTGTGATPRTYFDATFCADGKVRRSLQVNDTSAKTVAKAAVPQVSMTMVIVNSPLYGGTGGEVAVISTNSQSAQIGIHEMGHTAFGLADEYSCLACVPSETDRNRFTGPDPFQPNVTTNANRATNKWRSLVASGTAMPTTSNSDCTAVDAQLNPVTATTVGAFEGAFTYHCGTYRPQYDCYMRTLGVPFCAVCQQRIRTTLNPYKPPESLTLTTPSVAFSNVPQGLGGAGVTTYRAVVFAVSRCTPTTLRFRVGTPTGGFGTPLGRVVTLTSGDPVARLWLSYTSTTAGANRTGSVDVHCDETNQNWTIPIVANTVRRPKAAVAFVLDHSGSMSEDAGDTDTKVAKLREAANSFVDVMLDGDALGIVRFNDAAQVLQPVVDVGAATVGVGRTTARSIINGPQLDPIGNTSIGDGVVKAKQALDTAQAAASPRFDTLAVLVLTDGMENRPPLLAAVASSITARTFAIGLGLPANISVAALTRLAQGHNGYLLVTGTLTSDQASRLVKYFLQILAGVTNANVILDPHGVLVRGAEARIPFLVTDADYGIDVIVTSPAPWAIRYELEAPDGTRLTPADEGGGANLQFVRTPELSYYRLALPTLPWAPDASHAGTWYAILTISDDNQASTFQGARLSSDRLVAGGLPYDVVVHAYTQLNFDAAAQQTSFEPGCTVAIDARLSEYDYPLEGQADVTVDLDLPDGSSANLHLSEDAGGRFSGRFVAYQTGIYRMRVRCAGTTLEELPFTREKTLTAVVMPGADTAPVPEDDNPPAWLCSIFECLRRGETLSPQLRRRLTDEGIDLEKWLACLSCECPNRHTETSTTTGRPDQEEILRIARTVTELLSTPPARFAELPINPHR